jgi:hypothetical protein
MKIPSKALRFQKSKRIANNLILKGCLSNMINGGNTSVNNGRKILIKIGIKKISIPVICKIFWNFSNGKIIKRENGPINGEIIPRIKIFLISVLSLVSSSILSKFKYCSFSKVF